MIFPWLPLPVDIEFGCQARGMTLPRIAPPHGLTDFQEGWFWRLFFAMAKLGGYLPVLSNLCSIAGARRRDFWESHKSGVLACFEAREMGGQTVLCYPPLLQIIADQERRYQNRQRRVSDGDFRNLHSDSQGERVSSPSGSGFDFDFELKKEKRYSQNDFDARDLRKMNAAYRELETKQQASIGRDSWSERQILAWVCQRAGITVKRGLELEKIQTEWPA